MFHGVAEYERVVSSAREDLARKVGRAPSEVEPDLAALDFGSAGAPLDRALRLEPHLWRAHYYVAKIARAKDLDREAAEQFAAAIRDNPAQGAPYVALCELLRKWDANREAGEIARLGTTHASDHASELYLELGLAYADQRQAGSAIGAFSGALAANPSDAVARFQRGNMYFQQGDYANAKADLEEFMKAPGNGYQRSQANKMLMTIAAKTAH